MRDLFVGIYFFLLFYIALYGVHLYWLIVVYRRHHKQFRSALRACSGYPVVTVQLPVFNERLVVTRLIRSVAAFDWPADKLQIQVLDDSTDSTSDIVEEQCRELATDGVWIEHVHRDNRDGFKAGALQHGLRTAAGEFVAVFDADNLPRADFLKKTIGQFDESEVGMVQARWSFLNRSESLLCRAQALFLDAHFYIEQAARHARGLFMNFNGTAGVWRRETIDVAGGWQHDTLTEDLDLSYRAQLAGWKMVFLEDVDVPTELPGSIRSFKAQQYRWAKGAIQTARKVLPKVLRSKLALPVKLAALMHLTQKSVSLALLALSVSLVPALYVRLEGGAWKLILIDLPIIVLGTGSMSLFYSLAYRRERHGGSALRNLILPVLTSMGIALSVNNSLAVLSALCGRKGEFVRTPKTGSTESRQARVPSDYAVPFDLSVRAELFFAAYSGTAILAALVGGLYPSVPYLATFFGGFLYFAVSSLKERHVARAPS